MRVFKLSLIFFISALFITACTRSQIEQVYTDRTEPIVGSAGFDDDDGVWARENLDLEAVGELLPRADNAEELEYLLNNEDGINNLDLNGDGDVDYISVREFDDRYDDERGFSLYSMFGPDEIQEICTIIFDRDGYNDGNYYPGARVLLTGNEQIYGDDYYYESNWRDRTMPIVTWLFNDRDDYYRSPYYSGYYPDYYEPYPVVETVVYRERIREYYPEPVFIQTTQPTIVQKVRIASPYREKNMTKIYAKMAKPTRQQVEFKQKNPIAPEIARVNREVNREREKSFFKAEKQSAKADRQSEKREFKENRNVSERFERKNQNRFDKQDNAKFEKQQLREKPNKQERANFDRQNNQARVERQNQARVEKEQRRVEQPQQRFEQRQQQQIQRQQQQQQRQQMRVERQQQPRFERPQPQQQPRFERPQQMKQQRQENRGGGNPNKGGGGGNPNKGGGGGGGKKGKG